MLFSSSEVAGYINNTFEPAWESVRPAPQVTIDFGIGQVVRRTLQGNVATYVCGPDGVVYDVLPGIYTPDVYRQQLDALRRLADALRQSPGTRAVRLSEYHGSRAAALALVQPSPAVRAVSQIGGGFKGGFGGGGFGGGGFGGAPPGSGVEVAGFGGIEGPTERVIAGLPPTPGRAAAPSEPLASRQELALDTRANEQVRRRTVHQRLAGAGLARPEDIKRWLYKEVLRADLDDPLLGLGGVLAENYPFADEDRVQAEGK